MRPAALLWVLLALPCGCSHPLLLKKYTATTPAVPALKGRTVFVQPFVDQRVNEWSESKPLPDPANFSYREPTPEQLEQWKVERRKLGDGQPISSLFSVGVKRNGFGMPIMEVFAVNSPAQWLTDATRLELAAQGVVFTEQPEAADIVVQAVLRHAWLELYMATWVHLVVDLTTTVRGREPKSVRLHVSDGKLAWTGGDLESYEIFCSTEQKLQRYLLGEIARAASQVDAVPPAL